MKQKMKKKKMKENEKAYIKLTAVGAERHTLGVEMRRLT